MKLVKNILSALVALPLVAGLASCSEKEAEYSPAAAIANDEVYFVSPNATVELDETKDVAYIQINRVKTEDAITVPLNVTCTNPKDIPVTSVTFNQGSNVAQIPVSYDPEEVEAGKFDTIKVEIASADYTTPYGCSSVTVLFGKAQTWTTLGTCQFKDIFWDEDNYYDATVQQCDQQPNMYRVLDPYKVYELGGQGDDFVFYLYDKGEAVSSDYTAPYDGFVLYEPCNSGYYYSSYGQYVYAYHPFYWSSLRANEAAMNCNRVEAYQEDGTPGHIICSAYYYMNGVGGWNYSTADAIEIVMPGYTLADYSVDVIYTGKFMDTADAVYAVADITLGTDVSSAKMGVVAGDASQAGLDSIAANGADITASGEYKMLMPADAESGKYTVYVITYNSDGEMKEYAYETFKYTAPGTVENTWTAKYVGTYYYSLAFANEDGTPYEDAGLVLSQCDQDPTQWKIDHIFYDVTFYFTWDQTNNVINFEPQSTGAQTSQGDLYIYDMTMWNYDASYFDQETNTFKFDVYYTDGANSYGDGFESFKLTGTAQAAKRALNKAAAVKKHKAIGAKAVPAKILGMTPMGSGNAAKGIKKVKFEKKAF